MNVRWCGVPAPVGCSLPAWVFTAFIDDEGVVFIPARVAGNELKVALFASFDGVEVYSDDGRLYVPARWVAETWPEEAEACALIESRVRSHFAGVPA